MKKLFIILLLSITVFANAQTPKQNFTEAEKLYKNGSFTEAIAQTESVKKSLGKSNPKVEALLFLGYYNTQEYTKAKVAYETLKLMVPESVENSDAFKLYKSAGEQLDIKLAEIQTAFLKKQNEGSKPLYSYSQYEDRNDNKVRRIRKLKEAFDDRMEIVQENNENEAYQVLELILKNPTKEKFEDYLLEERYESKFNEVEKYIKYWNVETFMLFDYNDFDKEKARELKTLKYHLNLDFLNIDGKKISNLPSSIFQNGKLDIIAINNTTISSFPDNIINNSKLTLLTLKDNKKLRNFLSTLSHFPKLQSVIMQGNSSIYKLPYFGDLKNLKTLHLNQYSSSIPKEIFSLTKLKELSLGSISPKEGFDFPEEIGLLVNLEYLALYHGTFEELPKSIKYLQKLKELNLYNSWVKDLPSEIRELKNLQKLNIGGTRNKPYNYKKVERDTRKLVKYCQILK